MHVYYTQMIGSALAVVALSLVFSAPSPRQSQSERSKPGHRLRSCSGNWRIQSARCHHLSFEELEKPTSAVTKNRRHNYGTVMTDFKPGVGQILYLAKTDARCTNDALGELLARYLANDLPIEQSERVNQHLVECTLCSVVAANWGNMKAALQKTVGSKPGRRPSLP